MSQLQRGAVRDIGGIYLVRIANKCRGDIPNLRQCPGRVEVLGGENCARLG